MTPQADDATAATVKADDESAEDLAEKLQQALATNALKVDDANLVDWPSIEEEMKEISASWTVCRRRSTTRLKHSRRAMRRQVVRFGRRCRLVSVSTAPVAVSVVRGNDTPMKQVQASRETRVVTRRTLLQLLGGNAALLAGGCIKRPQNEFHCDQDDALDATERAARRKLAYVDRSTHAGQTCGNCDYYRAALPGNCGRCSLIPGRSIRAVGACRGKARHDPRQIGVFDLAPAAAPFNLPNDLTFNGGTNLSRLT